MIVDAQQIAYDPKQDRIVRVGPKVFDPKGLNDYAYEVLRTQEHTDPYDAIVALQAPALPGQTNVDYYLVRMNADPTHPAPGVHEQYRKGVRFP